MLDWLAPDRGGGDLNDTDVALMRALGFTRPGAESDDAAGEEEEG